VGPSDVLRRYEQIEVSRAAYGEVTVALRCEGDAFERQRTNPLGCQGINDNREVGCQLSCPRSLTAGRRIQLGARLPG
jgi:hypothetical protein